jgi:hypothetical protein
MEGTRMMSMRLVALVLIQAVALCSPALARHRRPRQRNPAKPPTTRDGSKDGESERDPKAGARTVRIRIKEPFLVLGGAPSGGPIGQNCTFTVRYEKAAGAPKKAECAREFKYKVNGRSYKQTLWCDFELPKPRGEKKVGFSAPGSVHVSGEGRVRLYLRDADKSVISNVLIVPVAADAETADALRARLGGPAKPNPQPKPKPKPAVDNPEDEAAKILKFARMCLANGVDDLAAKKLKQIVEKYPNTQAAKEARKLLAK